MAERVPLPTILVAIMQAVKPVKIGRARKHSRDPAKWQAAEEEAREIGQRILELFSEGRWVVIRGVQTFRGDGLPASDPIQPLTDQDVEDWQ